MHAHLMCSLEGNFLDPKTPGEKPFKSKPRPLELSKEAAGSLETNLLLLH